MNDTKLLDIKLKFETFSRKHTCNGEDVSPEISIVGLDPAVASMALILDDPDAPVKTFVHWVMWNIDPTEMIPEDIPTEGRIFYPINALQGTNDFHRTGYSGPCPPPGKKHQYLFTVYGLDDKIDLVPDSSKSDLLKAIKGHVLQKGEAVALYGC